MNSDKTNYSDSNDSLLELLYHLDETRDRINDVLQQAPNLTPSTRIPERERAPPSSPVDRPIPNIRPRRQLGGALVEPREFFFEDDHSHIERNEYKFNPKNFKWTKTPAYYDGKHEVDDLASKFAAMRLLEASIKLEAIRDKFMKAFKNQKFEELTVIYKRDCPKCPEAIKLIDAVLDKIPWRVSCEYYCVDDKIKWANSWIRFGWWHDDIIEISPQFENGHWVSDVTEVPGAVPTRSFQCVVWSGTGKEMLLNLIDSPIVTAGFKQQTNIALKREDNYWIPSEIAFQTPVHPDSHLDLAEICVGSLEEVKGSNLDMFRIFDKTKTFPDGTMLHFFQGCNLGGGFCDENFIHDEENNDYNSNEQEVDWAGEWAGEELVDWAVDSD